ncbi:MAG: Crp/Fnr family transcriptional regulator [Bacteroidota bacterium]
MNIPDILSTSPLFEGLNEQDIENIMHDIVFQVRSYTDANLVASRNEPCNFLLIVLEGTVKGEMLDASGRILKIEDIKAVRPLAPAFIFGRKNKFPVDIMSIGDVKIMYIPKSSLLRLMSKSDVFLNNFLDVVSSRAQFLTERIYFLSFKTIKAKLSNYFLELSKKENPFVLPHSHLHLAEMFGVTRPSLSRALADIQKEGVIKIQKKNVYVIDNQKLKDYL